MGDQNQPLGPYDPTEDDRDFARSVLDAATVLDVDYVLGTVESCVSAPATTGAPADREIRRARALLAEWRKRQAVQP